MQRSIAPWLALFALIITVVGSSDEILTDGKPRLSCKNTRNLWELVDSATAVSRDDNFFDIAEALLALGKIRIHVDISGIVPDVLGGHGKSKKGAENACAWYAPTYFFEIQSSQLAATFESEASKAWGTRSAIPSAFFCLPPTTEPSPVVTTPRGTAARETNKSNGNEKELPKTFGCVGPADNNATMKWMHVPKCGASFAPTMQDLGYCSKGHTALSERRCGTTTRERKHPQSAHRGNRCRVATVLRDPQQRLTSNFYFNSEFCLAGQSSTSEYVKACFESFIRTYFHPNGTGEVEYQFKRPKAAVGASNSGRRLLFAPTTNLWGCQAKMILGFECSRKVSALPDHLRSAQHLIDRAKEELDLRFDFIGDTESFDASVVLAHQQMGGQLDLFTALNRISANPRMSTSEADSASSPNVPDTLLEPWPRYENCKALRTAPTASRKQARWDGAVNAISASHRRGSEKEAMADICKDEVDEPIYLHGMRAMIANILKHHSQPVRFIDSSTVTGSSSSPIPSESSVFEKGEYMKDVTARWRQFYKVPDAQCRVLEHWEGAARKAATSLHRPIMGNRNSNFKVVPRSGGGVHGPRAPPLDMAAVCKTPSNVKEEAMCFDWKTSHKNGPVRNNNRAPPSPSALARAHAARQRGPGKAAALKRSSSKKVMKGITKPVTG